MYDVYMVLICFQLILTMSSEHTLRKLQKPGHEKEVAANESTKMPYASCHISSVSCIPAFPFTSLFYVQDKTGLMSCI